MHQFWVRLAGAARVLLLGLEHFAALRRAFYRPGAVRAERRDK